MCARCMLNRARPPCLARISGALFLLSLYRIGTNDAAAHHSRLTVTFRMHGIHLTELRLE